MSPHILVRICEKFSQSLIGAILGGFDRGQCHTQCLANLVASQPGQSKFDDASSKADDMAGKARGVADEGMHKAGEITDKAKSMADDGKLKAGEMAGMAQEARMASMRLPVLIIFCLPSTNEVTVI